MSQPQHKPYAATRSAALLTAFSVLSPLSGLAMEMVLAWRFGATGTVDAFRTATMLAALGTQLFFSYVLPHVIVPLFAEYRAKDMECRGWRLAFSATLILSLIALVFAGWVWLAPDTLVGWLAPGLAAAGREDARLLIRCFSLVLLLMAWCGMASGILSVYRIFWLSAVAQMLPNLLLILTIVAAGEAAGAWVLALGVLLGYLAMLPLFIYGLARVGKDARIGLSECLKFASKDDLLRALHLSLPLLLTIFIGQWSTIIINRTLSAMPAGTLAEFGYAWKLLGLVSLLPAGLATVIFPAFSEAHANDDPAELTRLALRALRMTLFLTLPLAMLLIVERVQVVQLMFGRGGMTVGAVSETGLLFGILLFGAPAGALSVALSKVAFAMHDTKSSTALALLSAAAFTLLLPHAAERGGAPAVAWVYSAIIWGCALLLLGYLIARYRVMPVAGVLRSGGLLAALGIMAALPVMAVRALFALYAPLPFGLALLEMALSGLVFMAAGLALSRALGVGEAAEIVRYIKWQLRQIPAFNKAGR
jgi:putative peptidoglycan lipid II flippase